jgi:GGDEF domain-containing protein
MSRVTGPSGRFPGCADLTAGCGSSAAVRSCAMIDVCRPAGTFVCAWRVPQADRQDPVRRFDKQESDRLMGQTHVNRWTDDLSRRIQEGQIDPSFVITHAVSLHLGSRDVQDVARIARHFKVRMQASQSRRRACVPRSDASIGLARYSVSALDAGELLRIDDAAMRHAERVGLHRYNASRPARSLSSGICIAASRGACANRPAYLMEKTLRGWKVALGRRQRR